MGRLEEIRKRVENHQAGKARPFSGRYMLDKDLPWLLERISELEAENERLRGHFEVEGEGLRCNVCGRWDGFNML